MFLLQRIKEVEPGVDLVEPDGVKPDLLVLQGQLLRNVFEFDVAAFGTLRQFLQRCVVTAHRAKRGVAFFERGKQSAFIAQQKLLGFVERSLDFLGVRKGFGFLFQLFLFVGLQGCLIELLQLEAHELFVGLALCGLFDELLQTTGVLFPSLVTLAVLRQQVIVVCQDVDEVELEAFLIEQQVLVLRMHVDELFAQFFHLRQGGRRIIDKSTALARGVDFTAQDAFGLIL
ncbi:hypothetical protein SDC9_128888 [bioreactor metagenome]|uniref:Uncharacterized protein n=1 Tax=bioreactor metagenome TaxID=1076179 RepID=A0A645CY59_9ZZZZ